MLGLLLLGFLTSCRTNSEMSNLNSSPMTLQTNTFEVQPSNSPKASPNVASNIDSKVGLVGVFGTKYEEGRLENGGRYQAGKFDVSRQFVCLTTQNSTLNSGDKIQVVLAEIPQKVFQVEVSGKLEERCSDALIMEYSSSGDMLKPSSGQSIDTSYSLEFSENDQTKGYWGIAVINTSNQVKIDKGFAHIDLDDDGEDEYFRECYGRESLTLSVWKGKPLIGKRIWSGYFGFNYDTGTETCNEKDREGIE